MMDMNSMADRCMDMMDSMMGGGVMGSTVMLVFLMVLILVWLVGLIAVGALGFWAVRKLASSRFGGD